MWSLPPHREPSGGRAIDVAGLQGSFPMPYDRPEWSRSTPQHLREKYFFGLKSRFSSFFMICINFWSFLSDFAVSASLSHRQGRSLSVVVNSAYHINEARIGRKMTGESSSIDPVWVLWGLEQARGHSEPIPCRILDSKKRAFFYNFSESGLSSFVFVFTCWH